MLSISKPVPSHLRTKQGFPTLLRTGQYLRMCTNRLLHGTILKRCKLSYPKQSAEHRNLKTARKAYFVICCSAVTVTVSSVTIRTQSIRISITSYVQTTRWITEANVPADTMSERMPLNRWLCLNCAEWQNFSNRMKKPLPNFLPKRPTRNC